MELREMILHLALARGPAGYEEDFAAAVEAMLREKLCLERDAMGNLLISHSCGIPGAPRLLVTAPMEEPGFAVCGYEDGFLHLAALGSVDLRVLPAAEMLVLTDPPCLGVIAAMPPHLLQAGDMEKCPSLEQLCLDVGLEQAEATARIPLGTPVVFASGLISLGEDRLSGPGAGNRAAAAAALLAVLAITGEKLPVDLSLAFTVQHGLESRGAGPAAVSTVPDYAVALEIGPAGNGLSVVFGPSTHRGETQRLVALAAAEQIPLRREVLPGRMYTDNWAIQTAGSGCAVSLLRLPVRYPNSPAEQISLADCRGAAALLQAYATALGEEAYHA